MKLNKVIFVLLVLLPLVIPTVQAIDYTFVANHSTEKAFKEMIRENDCKEFNKTQPMNYPLNTLSTTCMTYPYNRPGNGDTYYYYNEHKTGYIKDTYAHGDFITFNGTALTENRKIEDKKAKDINHWNEKCEYGAVKSNSCTRKWNKLYEDYLHDKLKLAVEYNVPLFIALHP